MSSRRSQNLEIAQRAGARLARPTAAGASSRVSSLSSGSTVKTSTPFGSSRTDPSLTDASDKEHAARTNSNSEWCGPFSVARRMIREREEARQRREARIRRRQDNPDATDSDIDSDEGDQSDGGEGDDAWRQAKHPMDEMLAEEKRIKRRQLQPSLNWTPSFKTEAARPASTLANRKRQFTEMSSLDEGAKVGVPTLASLCVGFLVDNFDCIESLGNVDSIARNQISCALAERNALDDAAVRTISGASLEDTYYGAVSVESLEVPDANHVTPLGLAKVVKSLYKPGGMRALVVGHAGLAFDENVVKVIVEGGGALDVLSIEAAYLLKDKEISEVLKANIDTLRSVKLDICPLLGDETCDAIRGLENLQELSLVHCVLGKPEMINLFCSPYQFLRSIDLSSSAAIDDDVVEHILPLDNNGKYIGPPLEHIALSSTIITDKSLTRIRMASTSLRSLELINMRHLTNIGLVVFFTPTEGLGPLPRLKRIKLVNCGFGSDAVNDEVVRLCCAASDERGVGDGLVECSFEGGGSGVSDRSMESLGKHCRLSLVELDVSFCHKISDKGLGYLCALAGTQFRKLHVWGMGQLTDDFFDGHGRHFEFEVKGVWMRKTVGGVTNASITT